MAVLYLHRTLRLSTATTWFFGAFPIPPDSVSVHQWPLHSERTVPSRALHSFLRLGSFPVLQVFRAGTTPFCQWKNSIWTSMPDVLDVEMMRTRTRRIASSLSPFLHTPTAGLKLYAHAYARIHPVISMHVPYQTVPPELNIREGTFHCFWLSPAPPLDVTCGWSNHVSLLCGVWEVRNNLESL